ncbi:nuclear transport factor 2 family protein [uncultured Ralstonia sp.]|jgi:ketosteroid isomerase-like protein|uniref:nuclear transport factor 2 family protein n=1 Tax=Ralstonia sp. TaxID=54061 RepID=UPI0025D8A042|nr:nuclear transport factor 2 family protein [uncultured Ralstonia sp.]
MGSPLAIVQEVYQAFGRGDIPALLDLLADEVDWKFVGSPRIPYSGLRRNAQEVARFFEEVAQADDIHVFEPREFIDAGESVVVLGFERSTARVEGTTFESEWVHVFTVRHGKVTRWRGFYDTAARFG